MSDTNANDMLTPADVAAILNVSAETVRKMCLAGKLIAVDVGVGEERHARRIARGEVDAYLGRRRSERTREQVRQINRRAAAPRPAGVESYFGAAVAAAQRL